MPACWNLRYVWCASAVDVATRLVAATNGPKSRSMTDTGLSAGTVSRAGGTATAGGVTAGRPVSTSACGGRGANTVSALAPAGTPTGIVTDARLAPACAAGGGGYSVARSTGNRSAWHAASTRST